MSEPKEKKKYTSAANSALPLVSVIPDSRDMKRVKKLLTEAAEIKAKESAAAERLSEIAEEMNVYMEANELKGVRWGLAGYEYRGWTTRKTLSREKLVENGVDPEAIAASMVEGKPFVDRRFVIFDL